MGRPRTFTSTHNRARLIADKCLDYQRTVAVSFTVAAEGNLERCYGLARGLQQSFNSMRSQDRNAIERRLHRTQPFNIPAVISSKYDAVSCRYALTKAGDGYEVTFELVKTLEVEDLVYFTDTGDKVLDAAEAQRHAFVDRMVADITSIPLDELFAFAEGDGYTGKDIVNKCIGPFAQAYGHEAWIRSTLVPAFQARYEATSTPPAPVKATSDDDTSDEVQGVDYDKFGDFS